MAVATLSALAAAGLVFVRLVDPRVPGNYPTCPFLFFTGCYCPGCGTLRALASLLEGNLRGAIGYNLLAVISSPILAVLTLGMLSEKPRAFRRFNLRFPPLAAWTTLAVIVIFWGLRNIPVDPLTILAP